MAQLDPEIRAHRAWLGYVQPEGLVVSPPALLTAQAVLPRNVAREQELLRELAGETLTVPSFTRLAVDLLGWQVTDLAGAEGGPPLPDELSVTLEEYKETLRPTLALADPEQPGQWQLLVQVHPSGTGLDEVAPTGDGTGWSASVQARFERLLRDRRVAMGLLFNGRSLRLVYAPKAESTGHLTFSVQAMVEAAGRPILGALLLLLGVDRLFNVPAASRLPEILRQSRKYQDDVSVRLAEQVLTALHELLRGLQAADALAKGSLLNGVSRDDLYGGLLTTILRLVFVLYAEDRGLLPQSGVYRKNYALTDLHVRLRDDEALHPDTMDQRYGAWAQLLVLFRLIFDGGQGHGLKLPARHGHLFNPDGYPFLEGRPPGALRVLGEPLSPPRISDGVVFRLLHNLLVLDGERLSYRALDVEHIGSVYQAMMGFDLLQAEHPSIALKPHDVVVDLEALRETQPKARAAWLAEEAECKLNPKQAGALQGASTMDELLAALDGRLSPRTPQALPPGALFLQPGQERRRSGSHYTPRSLTHPIVEKTLKPLVDAMGPSPAPAQLLDLRVCDPAMGSGAFLVEVCRSLGDRLVEAWARHGQTPAIPPDEDAVLHARRVVAQRCVYGVDKNPFAVDLAKLSLWLVTLAKDHPFTFLDHALRCGDSLVGLTREQIASVHWSPSAQLPTVRERVDRALEKAESLRLQIHALGDSDAFREKERLLRDADEAVEQVRSVGDVVVGTFFDAASEKERKSAGKGLAQRVETSLSQSPRADALRALVQSDPRHLRPFHWPLEFPEVFHRPNCGFDAFVGNPPFLGGKRISTEFGDGMADWLEHLHATSKNVDLSAQFFRRTHALLGRTGTLGLVATNTIAQGDTRADGLKQILATGAVIFEATRSLQWPGDAAVVVSVVHVAKGFELPRLANRLDGASVAGITSRLRAGVERSDPVLLEANANLSFVGSFVLGMGFTLTPDERETFVRRNPRNTERVLPYLGGEEVNTSPTQTFDRYVISFSHMPRNSSERFRPMTLEEAGAWPDLLERVREQVKPERDVQNRKALRERWWLFADARPGLYEALAWKPRCLVCSIVSKHLIFAWQPCDRVFSHKLEVFALEDNGFFAVLQSRVHLVWTRLLTSTMKEDLNYSATDCFENFPFPSTMPVEVGEQVHAARAKLMVERNQGLTTTYNQLKDPGCRDKGILELRAQHEELDRAVLSAYGWNDIEVPPYTAASADRAFQLFEDAVIDRLFALNAERAAAERLAGPEPVSPTPSAKTKRRGKSKDTSTGDMFD